VKTPLVAIFAVLTLGSAHAAKYAGEFMYVGAGARALAMGGAFSAISNDGTAGYWNPAGLTATTGQTASFMHSERFGGLIAYDYLAYTRKLVTDALGASLFRTDLGSIANTGNLQWYDTGADGVFGQDGQGEPGDSGNDDYDPDTNPGGTEGNNEWDPGEEIIYDEGRITWQSASDNALYLSWARPLSEDFSIGANVKMVYRDLMDYSAWGLGLDAALLWKPTTAFSVGLNLQDITGTHLFWNNGHTEVVNPTAKVGTAFSIPLSKFSSVLTVGLDGDFRFEGRKYSAQYSRGEVSLDTRAGIELLIRDTVGIRLGSSEGNMTAGIGLKIGLFGMPVTLDYAWLGHDELENTHRFSVGIGF